MNKYFYVTQRQYDELVERVFPDWDTRPFWRWLREREGKSLPLRPPGPGSQILAWSYEMLKRYMEQE